MFTLRQITGKLLNSACHLAAGLFYESICDDIKWYTQAEYWRTRQKLKQLKDKRRGDRCFIIGNGPSLNQTDLSALAGEYTFGMNRIYLLFNRLDFTPSYYICINPYVIEQSWEDILKIQSLKFISLGGRPYLPHQKNTIFLRTVFRPKYFSRNPVHGLWEGSTVTYCAMQLAYYMGFSEVILIGVDHHFSVSGEPNKLMISQGNDSDHFDPDYFGKGFKWQLPDLPTSEIAYKLAKKAFEQDGRTIVDATIGGHLQVFPKALFDEIVAK